ncbi:MAG: hypothetical protein HYR96_07315 [Deltaproteobacteria bacterium]|nr:hypothetical protein [Deltaproteobacteria bacterium]MBI3295150.1 hypothetical protein [Deltaproteobacteria bacterium]
MLLFRFRALSLLLALALSGCGYTLNHRLKDSFYDKRGIFVPLFVNRSDELGAERAFTNAIIHELQSRREVTITSREAAGLELAGEITSIGYGPTALTSYGYGGLQGFRRIPNEYGVKVTIMLRLKDPKSGAELWSNTFSGFRRANVDTTRTFDYQAPSGIGASTQSIINSLYDDIARDIMRDVYDDMVELF